MSRSRRKIRILRYSVNVKVPADGNYGVKVRAVQPSLLSTQKLQQRGVEFLRCFQVWNVTAILDLD